MGEIVAFLKGSGKYLILFYLVQVYLYPLIFIDIMVGFQLGDIVLTGILLALMLVVFPALLIRLDVYLWRKYAPQRLFGRLARTDAN